MGNKIQRIYIGSNLVRPTRKPGANTLAYYPLTSTTTINDQSGNNRNLTNNGVTFGTYGGISCASFPNANAKRLSGTLPLTGNQSFTISTYIQRLGNSATSDGSQIVVLGNVGSAGGCFGMAIKNSTYTSPNKYVAYTWGTDREATYANTTGRWELATITNDTVNIKLYINGVLQLGTTISFNVNSTKFTIGSFPTATTSISTYQNFYGYMSEFIVENKARDQAQITQYYNQTKSKYGL